MNRKDATTDTRILLTGNGGTGVPSVQAGEDARLSTKALMKNSATRSRSAPIPYTKCPPLDSRGKEQSRGNRARGTVQPRPSSPALPYPTASFDSLCCALRYVTYLAYF